MDAVPLVADLAAGLAVPADVLVTEQGEVGRLVTGSLTGRTPPGSRSRPARTGRWARRLGVGVEAKVGEPVEQGADADRHLGPGDVHAQADVRPPAEAERRPRGRRMS